MLLYMTSICSDFNLLIGSTDAEELQFDLNTFMLNQTRGPSCIAHLSAEDMLKSGVIEEKKFENTESE